MGWVQTDGTLVVEFDGRHATVTAKYQGKTVAREQFMRDRQSWWQGGERLENLPGTDAIIDLLDRALPEQLEV